MRLYIAAIFGRYFIEAHRKRHNLMVICNFIRNDLSYDYRNEFSYEIETCLKGDYAAFARSCRKQIMQID